MRTIASSLLAVALTTVLNGCLSIETDDDDSRRPTVRTEDIAHVEQE
ncbi:MAG: hypothetical protein GVY16_09905 [Planctomycetes bacterium]|nr:hypothetical protein [Planctomycetota bacterium]